MEPAGVSKIEEVPTRDSNDSNDSGNVSKATAANGEKRSRTSPKGNALRWSRGGITAGISGLFAFMLMARHGQLRIGVPLGFVFCAIATWGVMDLVGSFDDPDERVAERTTFQAIVSPAAQLIVSLVLFAFALIGASSGLWMAQWAWGLVVTATFLLCAVATYGVGRAIGAIEAEVDGKVISVFQRHGFWVLAAGAALYFPFMGSFSLWDPWETHYGEVAREILARDDWISLWWAQDGWFWSKPILNFWIQSVAMATLGVHYQPDQMLIGNGSLPNMHPEWAVRAPVVLMTILAMYLLYKGVAKAFGRRPALIGALVLATMPDWYFLAHQTMTDMPFVAAMTSAMGLLLIGIHTDETVIARVYQVNVGRAKIRLSGWHLVFGVIIVSALPQILYLISRNVELVLSGQYGFRPHFDEFRKGSGGGNCGLPGNEGCYAEIPAIVPKGANFDGIKGALLRLFGGFEPLMQGLLWSAVLSLLLYLNWGERRVRRLYYLGAWYFAAIATMGKGPAGFALPILCVCAYLLVAGSGDILTRLKRTFDELTRVELVSGLLVILAVALPWFVAMYVRHGPQFTDRLIFHDMFNRAFGHVHDTNEGDDTSFRFYVWQLLYAFFPWTGLVPVGLLHWLGRDESYDSKKTDTAAFLAMWFLFSFALFSFMGTKFHHYIFPAVPPVAMLVGIVVDGLFGSRRIAKPGAFPAYAVGVFGGVALLVLGLTRFWPGTIYGTKINNKDLVTASLTSGVGLVLLGLALLAFFILRFRSPTDDTNDAKKAGTDSDSERQSAHRALLFGAGAVGAAVVLAMVGRDLAMKPEHGDQPGAIRLLQLFTYNYRRPWPDSLDFGTALTAFAIVTSALALLLAFGPIRRHAATMFTALALVWAFWGVDVYMVKTAAHWGQREVIEAYYKARKGPDEKIIAYQMNWKGENFYTGNRIPAFVSTGSTFTTWLKKERDAGARVMFFVTEHSRIGGLKSEVGAKSYAEVTDKALCNKFVLVRAEL